MPKSIRQFIPLCDHAAEATMHSAYVVVTTFDLRLLVNVRGYVRPLTYTFVVVAWFDFRLKTLVATVWPTTTFDLHFWSIVVTKGVILP